MNESSRPLRICFVGWGNHVHVERWAGYFARPGYEVSVISLSRLGRYPAGVRQFRMGLEARGPRWHRLRLRWLLSRIRPDIVHVHWAHFGANVAAVWNGPLVITAWGSDIYLPDEFSAEDWRLLGPALKRAELLTCNASDLAEHIHRGFEIPRHRIEVVQWGVDTALFRPQGPDLRSELGLEGREVVFSARNFSTLHNQETVVAAFALVRKRRPKAFLLMKYHRGEPDYLARIRAQIAELGLDADVRIVESVAYEEMPKLYRTADVMVSVPPSDATPTSLFEAMAAGVPCVVSDIAPLREWVRDGETGYLVDPVDPSAVASAIESVLEGGEAVSRIKASALQVVIERASQAAHMAAMAGLYDELVKSRGQRDARLGRVQRCA
jgi:glycosyltransferase involved in cell wall biosynthesis